MIRTKAELKHCLDIEKKFYINNTKKDKITAWIFKEPMLYICKFVKHLRYEEYHHNNGGLFHKILYFVHRKKRTKLGIKLSIETFDNVFDEGLMIWHAGNIVVNGHSTIGKNCILHGSNCVGNNGLSSDCPVIGDNVRLGVGAKVIGGVTIADNIKIAAGAVVVHSFLEEGITIAGVPARKVK